jgi:Na+-transporting NADH:ubiquinone oxidoreductase subunit C
VRSNSYTVGFAAAVCIVCSLFVSGAATILSQRQKRNERVDVQKNILKCVGILEPSAKAHADEIESLYLSRISEAVISADGSLVPDLKPADLKPEEYLNPAGAPKHLPVFIRKDDGKTVAYAFPIAGKGLWSTLYGYLALDPDAATVRGITFYKHGETPGLGAEIDQKWFQDNFKGKKTVSSDGRLVSIKVVKGKAADAVSPSALAHYVDGISGATMTSNGVTQLLQRGLRRYEPYFSKVRSGS